MVLVPTLVLSLLSQDLRVDVQLVRVPCSVTDKRGAPMLQLTAKDFTIKDNGAERPVKYFARDTDLPLTVGLVVDISGSQGRFIAKHRAAVAQFFRQILRPGDKVFIIQFARDVQLLQDLTGDPSVLDAAIGRVATVRANTIGQPCPVREVQMMGRTVRVPTCGGSVVWDSVYYAAEKLRAVDGRKALIVMTDGQDSGSPHSLQQAIGMAQSAETVVYPIKSIMRRGLSDAFKRPLETIAEQTGGQTFDGIRQKPSDIFKKIQDELRTLYMLGFHADSGGPTAFHELKVTVARGGKVRTRSGYWVRGSE